MGLGNAMTLALRAFVCGFALAAVIGMLYDPDAWVLWIALVVGNVIGLASAYFGDWLEWLLSRFDDRT